VADILEGILLNSAEACNRKLGDNRENYTIRSFKIFGPCSLNINNGIKLRNITWGRHVASMVEAKNTQKLQSQNCNGRDRDER